MDQGGVGLHCMHGRGVGAEPWDLTTVVGSVPAFPHSLSSHRMLAIQHTGMSPETNMPSTVFTTSQVGTSFCPLKELERHDEHLYSTVLPSSHSTKAFTPLQIE